MAGQPDESDIPVEPMPDRYKGRIRLTFLQEIGEYMFGIIPATYRPDEYETRIRSKKEPVFFHDLLASVLARIPNIEALIASINAHLAQHDTQINHLDTRVTSLESRVHNVENTSNTGSIVGKLDKFVIDSTIKATGQVTLSFAPATGSIHVHVRGRPLFKDDDWNLNVATITIIDTSLLVIGDKIYVNYL
jgi:hypothetical protein